MRREDRACIVGAFEHPTRHAPDKSVAQRYQISSMPTLFIIDQNGLVRYVHAGFRPGDEAMVRAAIDSLL